MRGKNQRTAVPGIWKLAERQHGVAARRQLPALGMSGSAIDRRLAAGRLHRLMAAVYAVGRPGVTRRGRWMAAVLSCSPGTADIGCGAVLSHRSAAALWGIAPIGTGPIHVSVRRQSSRRRPGLVIHRRPAIGSTDCDVCDGIPTTATVQTLIDLAIARDAGLPAPLTGQVVNGFEVDFYWPDLGLVVETDGLGTTARRVSRRATGSATRCTHSPGSRRSASPTPR
jgi:hypothetical protein